jgi:hypothetical protein
MFDHTRQINSVMLRSDVAQRLAAGVTVESLIADLTNLREALVCRGRGDEEDMVLEVLDFLTGWCSPHIVSNRKQFAKPDH